MARHPRFDLPCFLNDADRYRYLTLLREALLVNDCVPHAYLLMDNFHMLVTPLRKGCITRMMHKLGRQYLGQFNALHKRTGSL